MIDIQRRSLLRREAWFDEPWKKTGADIVVLYHWKEPVYASTAIEVHSLEIDLTRDPDWIWGRFEGSTRNQINRAMKDGVTYESWTKPPRGIVEEFFAFQRAFSVERGLAAVTPIWMYQYAAQNALMLTRALNTEGKPLVWHSYARTGGWVRQLHSISLAAQTTAEERQRSGRANRYQHWMDMLECRKLGIERFDFGGWYAGGTDEKLLAINRFKEQFGGAKTVRYNSSAAVSLKGMLYLEARRHLLRRTEPLHFV